MALPAHVTGRADSRTRHPAASAGVMLARMEADAGLAAVPQVDGVFGSAAVEESRAVVWSAAIPSATIDVARLAMTKVFIIGLSIRKLWP